MPNINNLILVLSYLIQKKKKILLLGGTSCGSQSHIYHVQGMIFHQLEKDKEKRKKNNGNSEILGTTCFNLFKNSN